MAKVIGPLMSIEASGKYANTLVFDKRGRVRQYVVPANPNTLAQQGVRNKMGDIQRELKLLGVTLRDDLRAAFGPTWNSQIIGELTANGAAALASYTTEFNAFTAPQKAEWATADGATPVQVEDGCLLYAVASAVYDMGVRISATITLTLPAAANAAAVGAEWID